MTIAHWVIGAGGLLGSSVVRELDAEGENVVSGPRIRWQDGSDASADLARGLAELISQAAGSPWAIYWCAGTGTTASSEATFARDASVFARFIADLSELSAEVQARGVVFFASSAGALYGGSTGAPFTEASIASALGDYGRAKLAAETALVALSKSTRVRVAIGRITNLYGPGQSLQKQQGLISRLCVAEFTKVPLSIFVPVDTLRDYIFSDDCAALVVAFAARASSSDERCVVKILASGQSIGVGALISEFGKVIQQRPAIVWGQSAQALLQSRDLRAKSTVWADLDVRPKVTLADGIARTLEHTRRLVASTGFRQLM
jgi:UDP-glucose 4-epimerase